LTAKAVAGTVVAAIAIVISGLDSAISKTIEEAREHVESAKAQLKVLQSYANSILPKGSADLSAS